LEHFLKGHPKYGTLRAQIDRLPNLLKARLGRVDPNATVNQAAARWMRRQFIVPADKMNFASRYVNTVSGRLNSSLKFFGRAGAATTWVVPAGIGLWNVSQAPQHDRGRVFVQEAVGVVLGAVGTGAGIWLGGVIVAALTLTPIGAFLILAISGAAIGMAASEIGKYRAGKLYDLFAQ
jgi:hypothetical protein